MKSWTMTPGPRTGKMANIMPVGSPLPNCGSALGGREERGQPDLPSIKPSPQSNHTLQSLCSYLCQELSQCFLFPHSCETPSLQCIERRQPDSLSPKTSRRNSWTQGSCSHNRTSVMFSQLQCGSAAWSTLLRVYVKLSLVLY